MIELTRLTENDLELMMEWRMRPEIDAMMFNTVHLTIEGQKAWFAKIKDSDTQIRWVVRNNGTPIGSLYFTDIDRKNQRCESGWFVADKTGLQLTDIMALQQNSYDYAFDVLGLNRIYGYVMDTNKGLLRLLACCGIIKEGTLSEHVIKDGVKHDVYVIGLTKTKWDQLKAEKKVSYPKFVIE